MAEPSTTPPWAGLRVALVHDWLTGTRGGEKVLEALCRIFPSGDLLTLLHVPGSVAPAIEARTIRTSVIGRLPWPARFYRHYLPLFPAAIELFDLDDVDLVISTSHCAAKAVVRTGRARHVCYCHSPMRYAWDQFDAYFGPERLGRFGSAAARPVMAWLARWDRLTAPRVDRFLANSQHVAGRIARYYNRRASVVYPPVDTAFFTPGGDRPDRYFLVVSALVPYKRVDIAIQAAQAIGRPLKVVGTGPDEARLRAMAGSGVEFVGSVDADQLRDLYRRATALVLPGEEDFGISPVESLACGRPVVALGKGGACETVRPGESGALVSELTVSAFAEAMAAVDRQSFDAAALHAAADVFSADRFDASFRQVLSETLTSDASW